MTEDMMIAEHWVVTTRDGARLLVPQWARWLWQKLRHHFPHAWSLVLMPDHLHLVTPPGAGPRLRKLLSSFTGCFGVRFDVRPVVPANTQDIAMRMVRYGLGNPVRAGLVDDAWSWPWSTLRDLGGAAHPIWTKRGALAIALDIPSNRLLTTLTNIVEQRSKPLPRVVPVTMATFDALRGAVASALRLSEAEVCAHPLGRKLIVQASDAISLPCIGRITDELGCSRATIYRDRAPRHDALDAVLLCLGDTRLCRGPDAVAPKPMGSRI